MCVRERKKSELQTFLIESAAEIFWPIRMYACNHGLFRKAELDAAPRASFT